MSREAWQSAAVALGALVGLAAIVFLIIIGVLGATVPAWVTGWVCAAAAAWGWAVASHYYDHPRKRGGPRA